MIGYRKLIEETATANGAVLPPGMLDALEETIKREEEDRNETEGILRKQRGLCETAINAFVSVGLKLPPPFLRTSTPTWRVKFFGALVWRQKYGTTGCRAPRRALL